MRVLLELVELKIHDGERRLELVRRDGEEVVAQPDGLLRLCAPNALLLETPRDVSVRVQHENGVILHTVHEHTERVSRDPELAGLVPHVAPGQTRR